MSSSAPDGLVGIGGAASTLVGLLRARASQTPERAAYTFLPDGGRAGVRQTYAETDRRARAVAARLQEQRMPGERVLLLLPTGLDYVNAFFGCLYAGAVAVPLYPPQFNRSIHRLRSIVGDSRAAAALTTRQLLSKIAAQAERIPDFSGVRWVAIEDVAGGLEDAWEEPQIGGDTLALLQYTSGSISDPKGVMLTHRNLLHNSAMLADGFGYSSESSVVTWLPLFHDMGLIGGVIQPLYGGFPCVLMPPASFLQTPSRWLEAITRHRATISGGPNFAYELCARRIDEQQKAALDLSSWEVAFDGAEPVRADTLERFAEAFASCGFRRTSLRPCYGLAEATLVAACAAESREPTVIAVSKRELENNLVAQAHAGGQDAQALVGCGSGLLGERVLIVNPLTLSGCGPEEVGEIWLRGDNVARGYWNRPEETSMVFNAHTSDTGEGPFLRTGDLGFIRGGELFVTGRLKDLIIIRGRNYYPQDIEAASQSSHASLSGTQAAAFSVSLDGDERLVVVQEVSRHFKEATSEEVIGAIRRAVMEEHELHAGVVVLAKPGSVPRTTSGKIQRRACRAAYARGELKVIKEWRGDAEFARCDAPPAAAVTAAEALAWLRSTVALKVGTAPHEIDPERPIADYVRDSLLATELMHGIEVAFGMRLSPSRFMQEASLSQLVAEAFAQPSSGARAAAPSERPDEGVFTLSPGQKALWYLHRLAGVKDPYNIAACVRLRPGTNVDFLMSALRAVVERHASLRTTFPSRSGEPVRRIRARAEVELREFDTSAWSETRLEEHLRGEARRVFDLERGPLMRVCLCRRSARESILLLTVHHIVADFWSLELILQELKDSWRAAPPPLLTADYTDFVSWQAELLGSAEGERLWDYWREQLSGELPVLKLPSDHTRPPALTYEGGTLSFKLSPELKQSLERLSRSRHATLYMTLLAAYQVLLYRYTGQEDFTIGTPASGRSRAEFANLVGYFANPLAIRTPLRGERTFEEHLDRVRHTVLKALEHQDYPFAILAQRLKPGRDAATTPIFQTMFVWQNVRAGYEAGLAAFAVGDAEARFVVGDAEFIHYPLDVGTAKFELTLLMAEAEDGMAAAFEYNSALFEPSTVARLSEHFRTLLEAIALDPRQRVSELPLLGAAERQQVLFGWNDTGTAKKVGGCFHEVFEAWAERTPGAAAVVSWREELTYGELNRRANRLAVRLRELGVGPDVLVGLCTERSPELLVGLLGILKAGGAYVPLDPDYPRERLLLILKETRAAVVLTQQHMAGKLTGQDSRLLCLDSDLNSPDHPGDGGSVGGLSPDNLAYVIYTSGSTGTPKGVMISHRGLSNYLEWCTRAYAVDEGRGAPVHSSIGFDLTVTSLLAPLFAGRCVTLCRDDRALAELSAALSSRLPYSLIKLTPTHLSALRHALPPERGSITAKALVIGGEALFKEEMVYWREAAPATRLINEYGPTETVVGCCFHEATPADGNAGPVPIGRPIANMRAHVLNEALQPQPVNVPGELYVGGEGVARGYFKRPDLTAEQFVPDPFGRTPGERLYKTGDLARYLPDGALEFLGRSDEQVKIRGFRAEPGEVEAVLRGHPHVSDAAVVVGEERAGEKRMIAFLCAESETPSGEELRRYLGELLPAYLIPSAFVFVEKFPLNEHGKLDRRALLAAATPALGVAAAAEYVKPRTPIERVVAAIWRDVLGVERVGVHDNFFALGGHSLMATKIIFEVRNILGVEVDLTVFFSDPLTVEAMAAAVEQSALNSGTLEAITQYLAELDSLTDEEVRGQFTNEQQRP